MRVYNIRAFDIGDAWFQVLKKIIQEGYVYKIEKGSREGNKRKGLDMTHIEITNPSTRPLVPDVPEGIPPPTSMRFVENYLGYLITPSKEEWEEYTYGERITGNSSQLDKVIDMLTNSPNTNHTIIEIGQPSDILLDNPPCMRLLQFRIRYNKLHMFAYFRSWDAWGGLPSNLGALQLVKEYVGKMVGVEDGELFASSMGLHIYDTEWELAERVTRKY